PGAHATRVWLVDRARARSLDAALPVGGACRSRLRGSFGGSLRARGGARGRSASFAPAGRRAQGRGEPAVSLAARRTGPPRDRRLVEEPGGGDPRAHAARIDRRVRDLA